MPRRRLRFAAWSAWLLAAALAVVIGFSSWWGYESDDLAWGMGSVHEGVLDITYYTGRSPQLAFKSSGLWAHSQFRILLYAEPLRPGWGAPLGLVWVGQESSPIHSALRLRIVLWPFVPLLAALGWLLRRRSKRPQPNTCPTCRYDLTATPPAYPCPECGRSPNLAPKPTP